MAALEAEAEAVRLEADRLGQELRLARGRRDRLQERARALAMTEERRQLAADALETAITAAAKATDKQGMVN